jgi:hypothetical protein
VIAVRSDAQPPALAMVSPEQLDSDADGLREIPQPVNGTHLHPDCPHCDEVGQV